MTFQPGRSGNPLGGKRGPRKSTEHIRKLIASKGDAIIKKVLEQAVAGDIAAQQLAFRYLLPRRQHRFVSMAVDLPIAQSLGEAQQQIAMLVVMAARGDLDLDSAKILTDGLKASIDTALEEVDEFMEAKEVRRVTQ